MKKILFITEALWIGGIETALINLLNRIDYDEYDVSVLICKAELDLQDRIPPKCKVLVLDREKQYSSKKKYKFAKLYHLTEHADSPSLMHRIFMWSTPIVRFIENELYIQYIKKFMHGHKYDTVVIYSDRVAEIACRSIKADKYLLFYHNALLEKRYHDEIAYKKSSQIIAVSESKANDLKKYRSKYADKIIAIHNLVDLSAILEKSKEIPDVLFPTDTFNLVTCGRLAHQKAIDWAITACELLLKNGYSDIHWWVVGGGPDEQKLLTQIKEAGIEDHFHLVGMKNNPYPYIASADLYVQPSRYENYSVVILEAMALFKPILATRPAADQQIKTGVNGMLCDPTPEAICNSIAYLYDNKNQCEMFINYLKNHTLEEQNKEIMCKLYALF